MLDAMARRMSFGGGRGFASLYRLDGDCGFCSEHCPRMRSRRKTHHHDGERIKRYSHSPDPGRLQDYSHSLIYRTE